MEKIKSAVRWLFDSRIKAAIFIIILLFSGYFGFRILGQRSQKPQYQTARVEKGTIVSSISASGQMITANLMTISTNASGIVKQVFVKDGDPVVSGQKIAELELDASGQQKNAQAWSSYLSAKSTLDSANTALYTLQSDMFTKWKKFDDLAQNSTYQNPDGSPNLANRNLTDFTTVQDDWLAAESKYRNQQAVISQTQAALGSSWASYQLSSPTITAPMSGTINNITIVPGMILNSSTTTSSTGQTQTNGQTMAVVQNEGSLPLVSFNISEVDVVNVKTGQKATITLDSIPGKTFTGKVLTVDRIGQVTSGVTNYPVIIQFDTTSPQILPNMTATAKIITDTKDNILVVPSSAVRSTGGQSSVRVLKNGQLTEVSVETGLASDTQTEILSGLSEGEEVVIGTINSTAQQGGSSFGGGFGGSGALRPGGFGGRSNPMQH